MDAAFINSFLDRFLGLAESGFGLIRGDVAYVLNALIVISIALAGAQWALAGEAPMAAFFRKVLFVGLFAFLINNWSYLASAINQSGAMLGLKAGGGGMTVADLHNPGRVGQIGIELFGRTTALGEGMNIISDFMALVTIYIAAVLVMLGFFVLALQLFVSLIAFKLGSLAAFVALPWGVFNGTSWVAERPLGWVAGNAIRLFVLAFVASVAVNFVDTLPGTLTLDMGGTLNILLFGLTVLALAWFAPALANEVMSGQPSLSAQDVERAAQNLGSGLARAANATAGAARSPMFGLARRARASDRASAGGGAGGRGGARPSPNYAAMHPKPPPSKPTGGAK